jgi:predicted RNase H-like HicB family nuclease
MTDRDKMWAVEKPTRQGVYEVLAQWDGEAGVWVAESEDVPGLVAEADSPNVLVRKLRTLIPELLELNGVPNDGTAIFHVLYQQEDSDALTFRWPATPRTGRRFSVRMDVILSGREGVTMKSDTAQSRNGVFL